MDKIQYREISEGDLVTLFSSLRKADVTEIAAMTDQDAESAIRESVEKSELCYCAYYDDQLLCVFGIAPINVLGGVYGPWMIGTPAIELHKRAFWVASVQMLQWYKSKFYHLENVVHCDHVESVRWLSRLGFSFDAPAPVGRHGEMLMRFFLCV